MRRTMFVTIPILLAVLTGCGDGEMDEGPEPSQTIATGSPDQPPSEQPNPCSTNGLECSGEEVNTNGCDGDPSNAARPQEVRVAGASGVLELRLSNPADCDHIYWARFRPYAATNAAWVVDIVVKGQPREEQPSVPGEPGIDGYTEGVYAPSGTAVTYCLSSSGEKRCYDANTG